MINGDKAIVVKENHVRRKGLHRLAEDYDFGPDVARARATVHEGRTAVGTAAASVVVGMAATGGFRLAEQAFIHKEAWQR